MRFTLEREQWYAAEILGEEFGKGIRSHTRIQVHEVKPLGGRKFELGFFHENYPEGVQNKRYTLQTIERNENFILAQSCDHKPKRFLLIYANQEDMDDMATHAQTICALQFQGYLYEERHGLAEPDTLGTGLTRLIEPIVRTRRLHEDDEQNWAAFFGLQRYLFKWGGECLESDAPEHLAFDKLFLHLYKEPVPEEYLDGEYADQWQRMYAYKRNLLAHIVRQRPGRDD